MNLEISELKKLVIITIKEERLDAHNANDLKAELLALFEQGKKNILIDLQDVRFIDSSGLGALVSGFKNAITNHGSLKLASLQPQVKSMFELTRLHRVFDIYPTPADVPEQT
jgi:anti-sigma B factor antagonist